MIQKNNDAVVAAGAVSPLVALLQSDEPDVLDATACAFSNLAAWASNSIKMPSVQRGLCLA